MSKKKQLYKGVELLWDRSFSWRPADAEKAIIDGDVGKIASTAHWPLGEVFGSDESTAQKMCQKELVRLAKIGAKWESAEDRREAQRKKVKKHEEWLASCKCKETGQAWCAVCY